MRWERVTRPTWRGVKRAEDSVKEGILLGLDVEGGCKERRLPNPTIRNIPFWWDLPAFGGAAFE